MECHTIVNIKNVEQRTPMICGKLRHSFVVFCKVDYELGWRVLHHPLVFHHIFCHPEEPKFFACFLLFCYLLGLNSASSNHAGINFVRIFIWLASMLVPISWIWALCPSLCDYLAICVYILGCITSGAQFRDSLILIYICSQHAVLVWVFHTDGCGWLFSNSVHFAHTQFHVFYVTNKLTIVWVTACMW